MKQLVSIIIPSYNRAKVIAETLNSVRAQSYNNWECLVVDDGSTDSTTTIVNDFITEDSRFSLCHRPSSKKKGANACRNYGLEQSKGAFVLFLDSDDLLKPNCLELRLNEFQKNQSLDFVIANTSFYKDGVFNTASIIDFPSNTNCDTYLNHFLSYTIPWQSTMSVLWKKETIKSVLFDEDLMRFQDVDFHIRVLLSQPLKCYRINEIDNYYRVEDKAEKLTASFIERTLKAYLMFIGKHKNRFENIAYNKHLKVFNCKMLLEFILPYFYSNKVNSNKILKFNITSKQYGFNQKLYLVLLMFFLNTKLFKQSGIGMNSFRKQLKKVILN